MNMSKFPVIVAGAKGRMGQAVCSLLANHKTISLSARLVKEESMENGFQTLSSFVPEKGSVFLDFSHESALFDHLHFAKQHGLSMVVGTTGHSAENIAAMKRAALEMPLMVAPNTSLMNELFTRFSAEAAKVFSHAHVELLEIHHAGKKDAPSGTALKIAQAIKTARNTEHAKLTMGRIGESKRTDDEIAIFAMRAQGVTGEHTVYLFDEHERLELTHRISNRTVLAQGALTAAEFIYQKGPGLYGLNDVLESILYSK